MLKFFKVRGRGILRARYVDEFGNKGEVFAVLGSAKALINAGVVTPVYEDTNDVEFLVLYAHDAAPVYRFDTLEAAKAHVRETAGEV